MFLVLISNIINTISKTMSKTLDTKKVAKKKKYNQKKKMSKKYKSVASKNLPSNFNDSLDYNRMTKDKSINMAMCYKCQRDINSDEEVYIVPTKDMTSRIVAFFCKECGNTKLN